MRTSFKSCSANGVVDPSSLQISLMILLSCLAQSCPLKSSSIAFLRLLPRWAMVLINLESFDSLTNLKYWTNLVGGLTKFFSLTHPLNWTIYIIHGVLCEKLQKGDKLLKCTHAANFKGTSLRKFQPLSTRNWVLTRHVCACIAQRIVCFHVSRGYQCGRGWMGARGNVNWDRVDDVIVLAFTNMSLRHVAVIDWSIECDRLVEKTGLPLMRILCDEGGTANKRVY